MRVQEGTSVIIGVMIIKIVARAPAQDPFVLCLSCAYAYIGTILRVYSEYFHGTHSTCYLTHSIK